MARLKEVENALESLSGEEKIVAEWAYEFSKNHLPEKNTEGYYTDRVGDEPTVNKPFKPVLTANPGAFFSAVLRIHHLDLFFITAAISSDFN